MRKSKICLVVVVLIVFNACSRQKSSEVYELKPLSEEEMQWWTDAKFGMFIHWGPYALFEGEWKGQKLKQGEIAEWIMHTFQIPVEEYRKVAATFNPVKFNAEEWVELANYAGMKYLVITSKHHDGFAMYDSRVSDYNIVDYTPYGKDPMKDLAASCAKRDIKFCFYYSHREDWDHPYAYGNFWDYETSQQNGFDYEPEKAGYFTTYLEEKAKPQLRELLTNYGPIGLIWFDRGMFTRQQGLEFIQIIRELQPGCIVNGRVGHYYQDLIGDYQNLNDNGMPIGGIEEYWESPQTLNDTWGYNKNDTLWKSSQEIIHRLVEIVSKGGNYLLNIGPKGDGSIPQASIDILKDVGDWMQVNKESIYGTTASPFQTHDWGFCTVKGEKLYLHVLHWPEDNILVIKNLLTGIKEVSLLKDQSSLSFQKQNGDYLVQLPQSAPDPVNTVLVVELDGSPDVAPTVVIPDENGDIQLEYIKAVTCGNASKRFNRLGQFYLSNFTGPRDRVSWLVRVDAPGEYQAEITYSVEKDMVGKEFVLSGKDASLTASTMETGLPFEYQTFDLGRLSINGPGEFQLEFFPKKPVDKNMMYFKSIELSRIN